MSGSLSPLHYLIPHGTKGEQMAKRKPGTPASVERRQMSNPDKSGLSHTHGTPVKVKKENSVSQYNNKHIGDSVIVT